MHTTLKLYIKVQAILLVNNENIFWYKSTKEKIGFIAFTARQVLDDIPETSQFLPCQSHFSPRIIHSLGLLNTGEQIRSFLKLRKIFVSLQWKRMLDFWNLKYFESSGFSQLPPKFNKLNDSHRSKTHELQGRRKSTLRHTTLRLCCWEAKCMLLPSG